MSFELFFYQLHDEGHPGLTQGMTWVSPPLSFLWECAPPGPTLHPPQPSAPAQCHSLQLPSALYLLICVSPPGTPFVLGVNICCSPTAKTEKKKTLRIGQRRSSKSWLCIRISCSALKSNHIWVSRGSVLNLLGIRIFKAPQEILMGGEGSKSPQWTV